MEEVLGKKLKQLRTGKNMTQGMIADLLHTTRQRYARMENGQANISLQDIRILADFFGISTTQLTSEEKTISLRSLLEQQEEIASDFIDMERVTALVEYLKKQEQLFIRMKKGRTDDSIELPTGAKGPETFDNFQYPLYGLDRKKNDTGEPSDRIVSMGIRLGKEQYMFTDSSRTAWEKKAAEAMVSAGMEMEYRDKEPAFLCIRESQIVLSDARSAYSDYLEELLVPAGNLFQFVYYKLRMEKENLAAVHMIQLQERFGLPFDWMEKILYKRGIISEEQVQRIRKGYRYYGEERLAAMMGMDIQRIYRTDEGIRVPGRYMEYLVSNFENSYISFRQFEMILQYMDISAAELAGLRKPLDDRDEWDM